MTDQRLAGLSHQELWNLAHGGDPAAAATSQTNLSRAAQVLDEVARTLRAPLTGLDQGWRGQAADAARTGIGQHARWAEEAAARLNAAANQAGAQAASARTVIAQMPPPPPGPPSPSAPDWARVEQAQANARQRALELMQGHAAECAATRPTSVFFPTPPAGGGPLAAATRTTADRAARSAGRGTAEGRPITQPVNGAAEGTPGPNPGRARAGGPPHHPGRSAPIRTNATPGEIGTRLAAARAGQPVPDARPQARGFAPADAADPAGVGRSGTAGSWLPGPEPAVSRRDRVGQARQAGHPGPLARGDQPLGHRADGLVTSAGAAPHAGGTDRHDPNAAAGHHGQDQAQVDALAPPLAGTIESDGGATCRQPLAYLLDEHELFADQSWVAPPVIGA